MPRAYKVPRHGAAVVVVRGGKVLAITRGDDLANLNLPAGGLDPGESFEEGARRELLEETGVDARAARFIRVSGWRRRGAEGRVFVAEGPLDFPSVLRSEPFEGYVGWVCPADLVRPSCTFVMQNRDTLNRLGLL